MSQQTQIRLSHLPPTVHTLMFLAPPRLRATHFLERFPDLIRLKSDPKPILFFDRFLMPSWIHFGCVLGPILDPFWRQNRPKFRPRCPSKPNLLQKHDFHENIVRPMVFQCFLTPRPTPKWSKTGPRRIQECLEGILFCY